MNLATKRYTSISYISGPLLFVEGARDLSFGAIVEIHVQDGSVRGGQVIEVSDKNAVIQVFEETRGMDLAKTSISLREDVARIAVSREMIGRRFNGLGDPIDGLPPIIPEKRLPLLGAPINPVARDKPAEFIQTGISTIDVMNTLVRGQKLPIFSGAGLPANEIAAQITRQAKVLGEAEQFSVVFGAMGITQREASFFIHEFESTGALARSVVFMNLADDPTIERLMTPRAALTVAEYLAYELDMQVLVILTDMTNYCLAPETEVLLADGTVAAIGGLVDRVVARECDLGSLSPVLSWNGRAAVPAAITDVQKLRYRGRMLRIHTASGSEFSATPDHKILIDTPDGPVMTPAGDLSVGNGIYASKRGRTSAATQLGMEMGRQGSSAAVAILERVSSAEFALDAITSIEPFDYNGFVYDFTVGGTHNFLIENGLVVSNCEALREIGAAREEIPGRRGYPGYMYTDLASLYERAGRLKNKKGTITQVPILTMPDDDITHPIADLTGYITEGQLVLSRPLHRQGIYPPINPLPSLSRLMNNGIGKGRTRADHRQVADQMYSAYAQGLDLRRLVAIIGEEALTENDRMYLRFADAFEQEFINQGGADRSIEDSLALGWKLLSMFPRTALTRISKDHVDKYYFGEEMQKLHPQKVDVLES